MRVSGRKLTNPGAASDTGGVSVHASSHGMMSQDDQGCGYHLYLTSIYLIHQYNIENHRIYAMWHNHIGETYVAHS